MNEHDDDDDNIIKNSNNNNTKLCLDPNVTHCTRLKLLLLLLLLRLLSPCEGAL